MRFEAKHERRKRLASVIGNFTNIPIGPWPTDINYGNAMSSLAVKMGSPSLKNQRK